MHTILIDGMHVLPSPIVSVRCGFDQESDEFEFFVPVATAYVISIATIQGFESFSRPCSHITRDHLQNPSSSRVCIHKHIKATVMLATLPTEVIIRILGHTDPQSRTRCRAVSPGVPRLSLQKLSHNDTPR